MTEKDVNAKDVKMKDANLKNINAITNNTTKNSKTINYIDIKKEIDKLYIDFENDTENTIFNISKLLIIKAILKSQNCKTFGGVRGLMNKMYKIESKKTTLNCKYNNLRRLLGV